jgi:hypothetical protein
MRSIPATNVIGALAEVAAITALVSPLADVHRLSVANQLARLETGKVTMEQFDWKLLLNDTGTYGRTALEALAANTGKDERSRDVAKRATDVMRTNRVPDPRGVQDPDVAMTNLRERIAIRPRGATPEAALLERLSKANAEWDERNCVGNPDKCALWLVDLDRDGASEAVLLAQREGYTQATVYVRGSAGWTKNGTLGGDLPPLAKWIEVLDAGRVKLAPSKWQEVDIDGRKVTVRP